MPAHVTLIYPFVDPPDVDEVLLERLRSVFSQHAAFEVSFDSVKSFPGGTAYLEPLPSLAFVALTEQLVAQFGIRPYDGLHDTVEPHLTIGLGLDPTEADLIRQKLSVLLPIQATCREVWLVTGDNEFGWVRRETFALRRR